MLNNHSRSTKAKNVHLCIDNPPLSEFISALLEEWGYHQSENSQEHPLLLISQGLPQPTGFQHAITLSSFRHPNQKQLKIPVTIETLYLALENHFQRRPRNHIRAGVEWPLIVRVRGQEFKTHSITVADRGIRFISPFELAHDEEMQILIEQEGETYDLHALAVYSLVGKELGRGDKIEVGAVCTPQSKEVRDSIRGRIISLYLKRVRMVLGSNLFAEALNQLNLTRMSETLSICTAKG